MVFRSCLPSTGRPGATDPPQQVDAQGFLLESSCESLSAREITAISWGTLSPVQCHGTEARTAQLCFRGRKGWMLWEAWRRWPHQEGAAVWTIVPHSCAVFLHFETAQCKDRRTSFVIYDTLNMLSIARNGKQLSNLGLNIWIIINSLKNRPFLYRVFRSY